MTPRQQQIINYIQAHLKANGYPPTLREIGNGVGLYSSASVHRHLSKLREDGHITYELGSPRTVRVLDTDDQPVPYWPTEKAEGLTG